MPAPIVIPTWQEKKSPDEGQPVILISLCFNDAAVCLVKTAGVDILFCLIFFQIIGCAGKRNTNGQQSRLATNDESSKY
jgi:hypothetical protein